MITKEKKRRRKKINFFSYETLFDLFSRLTLFWLTSRAQNSISCLFLSMQFFAIFSDKNRIKIKELPLLIEYKSLDSIRLPVFFQQRDLRRKKELICIFDSQPKEQKQICHKTAENNQKWRLWLLSRSIESNQPLSNNQTSI